MIKPDETIVKRATMEISKIITSLKFVLTVNLIGC